MRVRLTKQIAIEAAHFLPDYDGPCKNLHGHTYVVELTAEGEMADLRNGLLIDFAQMGRDLKEVVGVHDHTLLNERYPNPTAENLARAWLDELRRRNACYRRLRVYETRQSWCEVEC